MTIALKGRLTRLERTKPRKIQLTQFMMIAESDKEQHHRAMLDRGYDLIWSNSHFRYWQPPTAPKG